MFCRSLHSSNASCSAATSNYSPSCVHLSSHLPGSLVEECRVNILVSGRRLLLFPDTDKFMWCSHKDTFALSWANHVKVRYTIIRTHLIDSRGGETGSQWQRRTRAERKWMKNAIDDINIYKPLMHIKVSRLKREASLWWNLSGCSLNIYIKWKGRDKLTPTVFIQNSSARSKRFFLIRAGFTVHEAPLTVRLCSWTVTDWRGLERLHRTQNWLRPSTDVLVISRVF